MRTTYMTLAVLALLAAGCDPEAPVQSSDVAAEIDGKIAVHAADSTTHNNLLIPAANVSGEFDGDQIEDGSIGIADLGTNSVGSDEIADQSISVDDLGAGSVGVLQLADDSVTTAKIAPNAVTATEIAAGAISGGAAGAIADDTVNSADIQNQSIIALDIGNDTITGAQIANDILSNGDIADNSLDATSLAANSVAASELADNAVDTGAIVDANVTTAKIADQAISHAKLNTNLSGRGTMGAPTMVFRMRSKEGMNTPFTLIGACRSDAAASVVIFRNATQMTNVTGACADTLNDPNETFKLTIADVDTDDIVEFQYDSAANGDTTVWEIYGISF